MVTTGRGTIEGVSGCTVMTAPPLIITEQQIDEALGIIDEATEEIEKELTKGMDPSAEFKHPAI